MDAGPFNSGNRSTNGETLPSVQGTTNSDNSSDLKQEETEESKPITDEEEQLGGPRFNPPLYIQRYLMVSDLLKKEAVKSVVDFGCAECNLLRYIRHIPTLEKIMAVDMDGELVKGCHWKAKPLMADYIHPRPRPLSITLLRGSVAEFDQRLKGIEACVLVELVEHLEPEVLQEFPPVVFGQVKPRLVFVSTPNSEYNVLFPNFSGVRHWDHKFEWTQAEFQSWCGEIAERFGYSVEYGGVGEPPEDSKDLGFCTQSAVFRRRDKMQEKTRDTTTTDSCSKPYELVFECEHPHRPELSWSDQLKLDVDYYLRSLGRRQAELMEEEADEYQEFLEVPVSIHKLFLYPRIQQLCPTKERFRDALRKLNYTLTDNEDAVMYTLEAEECSDEDEEDVSDEHNNDELLDDERNDKHFIVGHKQDDKLVDDEHIDEAAVRKVTKHNSLQDSGNYQETSVITKSTLIVPGQFSDAEEEECWD